MFIWSLGSRSTLVNAMSTDFVVEAAADALNQGREVERHNVELDAQLCEILLDQRQHALVQFVAGVGDHGEFHLVALPVEQGVARCDGNRRAPDAPSAADAE